MAARLSCPQRIQGIWIILLCTLVCSEVIAVAFNKAIRVEGFHVVKAAGIADPFRGLDFQNDGLSQVTTVPPCATPGWFPTDFGLKDHTIFWYDGYYYLVSIYLPSEDRFAYGRSVDLCSWETLPAILSTGLHGAQDDYKIWAPSVYVEAGVYYLYYTGVSQNYTQTIFLAISTNPDPYSGQEAGSWQPQESFFQPQHIDMLWQAGTWADCRDPNVINVGNLYYLYYTGRDTAGGIIGLAIATSPYGPWMDWGSILPPDPQNMLESSTIVQYKNAFYLFYHIPYQHEVFRVGGSPAGPWFTPETFQPGWAHEVWQDTQGGWFTSFLTDYTVTISPLTWDDFASPPRPWISAKLQHQFLPVTLKNVSP